MPNFKAKNPNSISAGAPPHISLESLQRSPSDLLTEFNEPTSKGLEEKRREMGVLWGRGREGKGGHPEGLVHTLMSEILKNTLIAERI